MRTTQATPLLLWPTSTNHRTSITTAKAHIRAHIPPCMHIPMCTQGCAKHVSGYFNKCSVCCGKGIERGREQGPERKTHRGPERGSKRGNERGTERNTKRGNERGTKRGTKRGNKRGPEQSPKRGAKWGTERDPERGPKRRVATSIKICTMVVSHRLGSKS